MAQLQLPCAIANKTNDKTIAEIAQPLIILHAGYMFPFCSD
jgi:hypothetical protein